MLLSSGIWWWGWQVEQVYLRVSEAQGGGRGSWLPSPSSYLKEFSVFKAFSYTYRRVALVLRLQLSLVLLCVGIGEAKAATVTHVSCQSWGPEEGSEQYFSKCGLQVTWTENARSFVNIQICATSLPA